MIRARSSALSIRRPADGEPSAVHDPLLVAAQLRVNPGRAPEPQHGDKCFLASADLCPTDTQADSVRPLNANLMASSGRKMNGRPVSLSATARVKVYISHAYLPSQFLMTDRCATRTNVARRANGTGQQAIDGRSSCSLSQLDSVWLDTRIHRVS